MTFSQTSGVKRQTRQMASENVNGVKRPRTPWSKTALLLAIHLDLRAVFRDATSIAMVALV